MLIEVKEPSAVIPLTEYERLKKIEDRYQDDIERYRQQSKATLVRIIDQVVGNSDNQLIMVTTDKTVGRFMYTTQNQEQLQKFVDKGKVSIVNEDKERMKQVLIQELDRF